MGALFSELVSGQPGTVALAALFLLVANFTEGLGLLALIPLLHAAGFGAGEPAPGGVGETVRSALEAVGIGQLTLPAALGIFVALLGARAAAAWRRETLLTRARFCAMDRLRERLHEAIAAASWRFLAGWREADLRHVLTGDVHRVGAAFAALLQVLVGATIAATHLAVAFAISPPTGGAILVVSVGLLWLAGPFLRRSETLGGRITGANREIYAGVQDFLSGLKFAKSHAAERAHVEHLAAAVRTMRERRLAAAATRAFGLAAVQVGAAVVLAAGGWFVLVEAGLPPADLFLVIVLSARAITVLGGLQRRAHELADALPAFHHTRGVLADLVAAEESPGENGAAPSTGRPRGARAASAGPGPGAEAPRMALTERLSLRGVGFDYRLDPRNGSVPDPERGRRAPEAGGIEGADFPGPSDRAGPPAGPGAGRAALRGVDLDLDRGEFLVLSGPSGAGKSTLADLLVGLMPPTTGRITVDGVEIAAGNRRRWRASCSWLAARPYLFPGRIRENLAWGRPEADDRMMRRALEAAAADFVFRLRRGLDTEIGDGGLGLSAGELQRLALAQAILRRPTLLVLDEATSQLDEVSESQVLETLRALRERITIVAATHSPSFLAAADRIARIESGRLRAPEPSGRFGAAAAAPIGAAPGGAPPRTR